MANTRTRKVVQRDRLSELPKNLQESILDRLPLRDAVRTSVLSKQWRHSWTMISRLIFDSAFFMIIWPTLNRYQDPKLKTREFLSLVDKILQLHNGRLVEFSLGFLEHRDPKMNGDVQMISDQIKEWIPLLLNKCVKQLTLENFISAKNYNFGYEFDPKCFSSLKLTHLKVRCAHLPQFGAFNYLTNLKLVKCRSSLFVKCVFKCPLLERLTMIGCAGLYHTNFHAPNLKYLYLEAIHIRLEGLKAITDFTFCVSLDVRLEPFRAYKVATLLDCLHKVEKLTIGYHSLQHLASASIPERDPKPLNNLKCLNIGFVDFTNFWEVACIAYIIRSAPYLCNLVISGQGINYADGEAVKNFEVEDAGKCNVQHLEHVEFIHFKGFRTEMELIKFIAAHSPLLKEMFIFCDADVKRDEVIEEMGEFAFASPEAKFYLDWGMHV